MPVSMDTLVDPAVDYMAMQNPEVPLPAGGGAPGPLPARGGGGSSPGGDYMPMNTRPSRATCHRSRSSASRRTFRRRVMRRQSHCHDLVILHTQQDDVFEWAKYIKTEVESRRVNTHATLISSVGFIPEAQDNVRRTLTNTQVVLVIVSPDLVTSLDTVPDYSFDFIPAHNMAASVLFFCGVDESAVNIKKHFPHYEKWTKFSAHTDENRVVPILEQLAKLIRESTDSSPESECRARGGAGRRGSEPFSVGRHESFSGPRVNLRGPKSPAWRPPQQRRRGTLKDTIQIFPDRGRCDQTTDVVVILSDDLLPCHHLAIECTGEYTYMTTKLETTRLNNCTFQFTMPEGMCETMRLRFIRDTAMPIGSSVFHYESPLDDVEPVTQLLLSCVDGLCELVRAAHPSSPAANIDQKLIQILQNAHIPTRAFEQLFSGYLSSTRSESSSLELPTLLHLAAKHGLQEVTAMLVDLPGAKQAFSITNRDGYYPTDLASLHGHHELTSFLEDYMDTVENEEMIYTAVKTLVSEKESGSLSEEQLISSVPAPGGRRGFPSDDYCVMGEDSQDTYMPMTQQEIYMPMTRPSHSSVPSPDSLPEPLAEHPLRLDTEVPGPAAQLTATSYHSDHDQPDYMAMGAPPVPPPTTRRPPPPPPRDTSEQNPRLSQLQRSSGIDLGSKEDLDTVPKPDDPPAPIVPFDNLLAPNERAPQLAQAALASEGQKELLEIIYQARDGELSMQEAESLVAGWKKQYQTPRWDKKSFKEKKESIRYLKDSMGKTAEKVKEELEPKQTGIFQKLLKRRKKGQHLTKGSSAPPVTKASSEPSPSSEPSVDVSRLRAAQSMFERDEDMPADPVCMSIPDLPVDQSGGCPCYDTASLALQDSLKRFSTISNSSSSSTVSCMSRSSYGSQQDSGIDVPIREESPALTSSSSSVYDRPVGAPRPVLPVVSTSQVNSSDECSGYEDVDHWLEPDGGSVRERMQSDSSEHTEGSLTPTEKAAPDMAPPVPPRSRCSSQSSLSDLQPGRSPVRKSHLLPPKTPRKSNLPQLRSPKYPAVAPKPASTPTGSRSASESSGSEEGPGSGGGRASGIPTMSYSGNYSGSLSSSPSSTPGGFSGLPSPRAGRPVRPNYSNVVIDLKNRQKKMADGALGSRNSRGSTSGEDSETCDLAPPVPPRSPRD